MRVPKSIDGPDVGDLEPTDTGSDDASFNPVDPVAASAGSSDGGGSGDSGTGSGRKRRSDYGQARGPRGPRKKAAPPDLAGIQTILVSIHHMLAAVTHVEELDLDPIEAEMLTKSIGDVAAQFPNAVIADPKITAILGLCITAGTIYGGKAVSYRQRKAKENEKARQEARQMPNVAEFSAFVEPG